MRKQTLIASGAGIAAALALGFVAALLVFRGELKSMADPVSQVRLSRVPQAADTPAAKPTSASPSPRPTVTVTKRIVPRTVYVPRYYGDDEAFLEAIAGDGIKAPDSWAIEAGQETCGTSYSYAYQYLTDGGLYGYHVQTFMNDWIMTHGGC
jgi:hypothetical protein